MSVVAPWTELDRARFRAAVQYRGVQYGTLGDLHRRPRVVFFHTIGKIRCAYGADFAAHVLEQIDRNDSERLVAMLRDEPADATRALLALGEGPRG